MLTIRNENFVGGGTPWPPHRDLVVLDGTQVGVFISHLSFLTALLIT